MFATEGPENNTHCPYFFFTGNQIIAGDIVAQDFPAKLRIVCENGGYSPK
jgi:hypothetical protein